MPNGVMEHSVKEQAADSVPGSPKSCRSSWGDEWLIESVIPYCCYGGSVFRQRRCCHLHLPVTQVVQCLSSANDLRRLRIEPDATGMRLINTRSLTDRLVLRVTAKGISGTEMGPSYSCSVSSALLPSFSSL